MLDKAPASWVSADGQRWNRFVAGTQGDWHVLRAPACALADLEGTGAVFDRIALSDRRSLDSTGGSVEIEFALLPFRCLAG